MNDDPISLFVLALGSMGEQMSEMHSQANLVSRHLLGNKASTNSEIGMTLRGGGPVRHRAPAGAESHEAAGHHVDVPELLNERRSDLAVRAGPGRHRIVVHSEALARLRDDRRSDGAQGQHEQRDRDDVAWPW